VALQKEDYFVSSVSNLFMLSPLAFGVDSLLADPSLYRSKRIALVTNDAALTIEGELSRVALLRKGVQLVRLFSPEHGIHVLGADGEKQQDMVDPHTSLSVVSLYGETMIPSDEYMRDIDVVLFDIPDVGCRYYTYLWTLTYVMEACVANGKPLVVLDRPNPTGAVRAMEEGPMLDEKKCSSFIGRWNIPLRHACTLGELARHFQTTRLPDLALTVIPVTNYKRHFIGGKDFPFYPTSPAIRNAHTAMLYPGTGLWEGININEGRGTEKPFSQCGAPWMDGDQLTRVLNEELTGLEAAPVTYTPTDSVYKGEICRGISLRITSPDTFRPVRTGLQILKTILSLYSSHIHPRLYKTQANPGGDRHLDLLLGIPGAMEKIQRDDLEALTAVPGNWIDERSLLYDSE
jgi:uncharacterized protein YbbC (DUF1343 family)